MSSFRLCQLFVRNRINIFSRTGRCWSKHFNQQHIVAMQALDFEIFGLVQGVNFRMYTKEQAEKLGLRGWCKNTSQGTVLGHMQGPSEQVGTMMHWLKTTGSPSSHIDKAEFRNQKDINEFSFDNFVIKKD